MKFVESEKLRIKAKKLIPGGAHTYSKGDDQFPQLSPGFIVRGKGAQIWDVDGNQFLDWGMGLRSVCLGHAEKRVLAAVKQTLGNGVNFTRPSPLEAELAELFVDLIPCAEMVKFAKNGSDVTTAAVRLARAYTGNDIVIRCMDHPFFSVNDWFIGDTVMNSGVPNATKNLTKNFPYNDAEALSQLMNEYKGKVACIILEPAATQAPEAGFLERVRELATQHNAVLIFDEIITGFRWDPRGAQSYYGVTPDLSTFGKSIANGFSLAALVGKRDIMKLGGLDHSLPRVFLLSSTNGGETHSLAAALQTIETLVNSNIIEENWKIGRQLVEGFNLLAESHGIEKYAKMLGVSISPWYAFYNKAGDMDLSLRTLFLQEMIQHGILMPYISISAAHRQAEVTYTLEAIDKTFKKIAQAVKQGKTDELLVGAVVKPVFRKYN